MIRMECLAQRGLYATAADLQRLPLNEAFSAWGIAADGKLDFSSEEGNICAKGRP